MHSLQTSHTQKGAVLVVSLLIMLIMTVIGVVGISTANLEERMAANNRDREIAFQAAEYALREGERYVQSTNLDASDFFADCAGGMCQAAVGATAVWVDTSLNVWNNSAKYRTYAFTDSNVREKPKYIIEFTGYAPPPGWDPQTDPDPGPGDPQMFRITSLGTGGTTGARVMLQSTYQKDP